MFKKTITITWLLLFSSRIQEIVSGCIKGSTYLESKKCFSSILIGLTSITKKCISKIKRAFSSFLLCCRIPCM